MEVSSDNENAVTAAYADGEVTLTSKTVTGMEKATVTVESEGEKTTVDVIVTDEKDYEIVDLRVGDTKTYTDKTGNYSDSTLDGLDKNIADVTLVGEDAQAVEKQVKAQLATAQANFNGEKVSLDNCMFTFESVANKENTYKISAQAGDKKVYVNHKKAPSQCVSTETETEILLESHEDGTVSLKDMTEGTGGAYLYFWKGDTSKLHFDRYSSDVAQCHMELWKAAPGAKNDLGMPGYEKVTDISQLTSGTKYLITAKADDGTYYAVNPSAASSNFNHVAKVVEENIPIKEEASVALGTNAQFDNGGEKKISKCLFTFDKQEGTENQYKITAVTEDGKKVYLGPKSSSGANRPLVETEAVITVAKNGEAFTLQQAEDASNSKYLYFWKDDASKFHFDRNGSVDSKGKCDFELYRKMTM